MRLEEVVTYPGTVTGDRVLVASSFLTDRSNAVLLLWIVFAFVILPCLFLAALWSPVGKGETSFLPCI